MIIDAMKDARAALKSILGNDAGIVERLDQAIHDYIKLDNAIATVLEKAVTIQDPRVDPMVRAEAKGAGFDVEIVDSDVLDNLLKASGR